MIRLLEFLCVNLYNQCDNAINQCYFIFCIVVHNEARHIVTYFLWVHPNSHDCVCNVIYMNIFVYIYIYT